MVKMKKTTFFVLLSACLMIFCFSVAFADSSNVGKTSGYIETDYLDGGNEMVDLNGEGIASYDVSFAAATLNSNERSEHSSAGEFVETCDNDGYSECELVMTAIDDNTYELAMPDGMVIGTFHKFDDEDFAVPYTTYNVNWVVSAGGKAHSTTYIESAFGLTFTLSINTTPSGNTKIGFYRSNDRLWSWVPETFTSAPINGYFTLNGSYGPVAMAIWNQSSNSIRYTGWFSV